MAAHWRKAAADIGDLVGQSAATATAVSLLGEDRVRVRFDQPASLDLCEKLENKQRLEASLSNRLGRRMQVEFESAPAAGPSAPPRRSRRQIQSEAAQQPFVKQAMELFDVPPDKMKYTPPSK